ncbi:DinB family protein [Naumannella huperziae]
MPEPKFPEPASSTDVAALFADYLDFYRESVIERVADLDDAQLRASRLPSGWSPIELIKHLVFMERRWFVWGFLGSRVDRPWGDTADDDPDGAWHVGAEENLPALVEALRAGGALTRQVLAEHALDEIAPAGPRFEPRPPASLAWICVHVINEYARHLGHLDIVRELIDGRTGE